MDIPIDLLGAVTRHLNSALPHADRLGGTAEVLRAALGAGAFVIRDVDPESPLLRLRACAGALPASPHQLIRIGKGGPGLAAAERRTVLVEWADGCPPANFNWAAAAGLSCCLTTPLVCDDAVCGVMSAAFATRPDAAATTLLEAIAPIVALAIAGWSAADQAQMFRAMADASSELVTTFTPDGDITYINAAARARLGIRPDETPGSIFDYRRDDWRAILDRALVPSLRDHGRWRGDTEHVTRAGDSFLVSQTSIAHRGPDGAVRLVSNLSREVGEVEDRLRRAEERTRFALEAAQAGVWEHDVVGGRVIWSDTMQTIQGFGSDEVVGTFDSFLALIHPGDRQLVTATVQEAVASARPFRIKFRILWPDGSVHWIESHARVLVDPLTGESARVLGFAQDVSERELLEERLRKAQRIEAVGQLAGGLAHDFNNLLTVILGFAGLLNETFDESDSRRDEVEEIRRAGSRAAELTRQLLAFSRQQVMQPVVLNLDHLVDESARMLKRLAGENIAVKISGAPNLPAVKADRGQLEQVLVNLVVNARDAMPVGGTLTIRTSAIPAAADAPARVRLEVSDTGIGMDDAVKRRIFEPFFTTKAVGHGTGLGLATVFGIVGQSGGTIDVQSAPGKGATFVIELPAVDQAAECAGERPDAFPRGSETILVVEDDAAVRALVAIALRRCGYETLVAATPAEAMALSAEWSGRIDLLLTDVIMPGMSGSDAYRELLKTRPSLSVAYMSGFAHQAIERHGVLKPGVTFLQKPFTASELARRVRAHLDGLSEVVG